MPPLWLGALLLLLSAAIAAGIGTRGAGSQLVSSESYQPHFVGAQLTPVQFLFVSSPKDRKVVYTELKNFQSSTGRVFALVDSGLVEPAGLAFDRTRSALYIADRGAGRIVRYHVIIKKSATGRFELVTDGVQLCIMQGTKVEWVTVDPESGDVFYSDQGTNTINKITSDTVQELANGAMQCGDVRVVSEKVRLVQAAAAEKKVMDMTAEQREASLPTDAPNTEPMCTELYEGSINPHVTVPGGVVSDGVRLYWTNKVNGKEAGSAVVGEVRPGLPKGAELGSASSLAAFPTRALTNQSNESYGIAKSNNIIFFTTNSTGSGTVYGVMEDGHARSIVGALVEPRGLVWDGDNTMYVADQATSTVWSFPAGRLMEGAPIARSAVVEGAFGVALLTMGDSVIKSQAALPGGIFLLSWPLLLLLPAALDLAR